CARPSGGSATAGREVAVQPTARMGGSAGPPTTGTGGDRRIRDRGAARTADRGRSRAARGTALVRPRGGTGVCPALAREASAPPARRGRDRDRQDARLSRAGFVVGREVAGDGLGL